MYLWDPNHVKKLVLISDIINSELTLVVSTAGTESHGSPRGRS